MNTSASVRYELWEECDGGYAFFDEANDLSRRSLQPGAKLVWSCTASSWEEAQTKKHEHLGWPPYEPMA